MSLTWLPQQIEHTTEPVILPLDHHDARRAELTGAKAANLARARTAGLPALPGFVVTTWATPLVTLTSCAGSATSMATLPSTYIPTITQPEITTPRRRVCAGSRISSPMAGASSRPANAMRLR